MTELYPLSADGIALGISATGGLLCDLAITDQGRTIRPLHRAPWARGDEPGLAHAPAHLRRLEGDFFCAPFAGDVAGSDAPAHGWPANGSWREAGREEAAGGVAARFVLEQKVHGAEVQKRVALRHNSPVVYQTHVLKGGSGRIPVAHHAMVHVPQGAALSFSPKAFGATPPVSLEEGTESRALLAYPQRFTDLRQLRLAGGGVADGTSYPFAEGHEDFLALVERPGAAIGWSAAVAPDFVFFAIKDARLLPQTILWMSNGGRRYAPWNGRHRHVLGIEEACTYFAAGAEASASPNELAAEGVATSVALAPQGEVAVRYALGAIARPEGFTRIADIAIGGGEAVLTDISGAKRAVPFDSGFFDQG